MQFVRNPASWWHPLACSPPPLFYRPLSATLPFAQADEPGHAGSAAAPGCGAPPSPRESALASSGSAGVSEGGRFPVLAPSASVIFLPQHARTFLFPSLPLRPFMTASPPSTLMAATHSPCPSSWGSGKACGGLCTVTQSTPDCSRTASRTSTSRCVLGGGRGSFSNISENKKAGACILGRVTGFFFCRREYYALLLQLYSLLHY